MKLNNANFSCSKISVAGQIFNRKLAKCFSFEKAVAEKIDRFSLEGDSQIALSRTAVNSAGRNDNMISALGCRNAGVKLFCSRSLI